MPDCIVLIGGNLSEAQSTIQSFDAIWDTQWGKWKAESSVLYSEAWGVKSPQPKYWNQCRILSTHLSPIELLLFGQFCQLHFENHKQFQYDNRVFDFDILTYGELQYQSKQLMLPHPRIQERKFVLDCLIELVPNMQLPGTQFTIQTLWQQHSQAQ